MIEEDKAQEEEKKQSARNDRNKNYVSVDEQADRSPSILPPIERITTNQRLEEEVINTSKEIHGDKSMSSNNNTSEQSAKFPQH